MKLSSAALLIASLVSMVSAASAQGRGDYLNLEAPQVKPIAVASVDGIDYLLVCNTPDNSVEVYRIQVQTFGADTYTFVKRIPVGLEPVSVAYRTLTVEGQPVNMMYTANWLGDSVTFVELDVSGNPVTGFSYRVRKTIDVGDEPTCVAVMTTASQSSLFVTKRSASSYSQLDPITGEFQDAFETTGTSRPGGGLDVVIGSTGIFPTDDVEPRGMFTKPPGLSVLAEMQALKEPHAVVVSGASAWFLGHQGGGSKLQHFDPDSRFNLDLVQVDFTNPALPTATPTSFNGTFNGVTADRMTTNFNLAVAADGDRYVVGTDAMNAAIGNPALLAETTGFVRTVLVKMDGSTTLFRDLNTSDGVTPVADNQSLAHATDVAVYRPQASSNEYVCVVAFNSDRFAIVNTTNANPNAWGISRVNLPPLRYPNGLGGPRGIVVRKTGDHFKDRAYVLNRLDNSVAVVALNGGFAPALRARFLLQSDRTPAHVRAGQEFLYSAKRPHSGSGFVACASCHVDARSDQLQWRLGPSEDVDLPFAIHRPLDIPVADPTPTNKDPIHEIADGDDCVLDDLDTRAGMFHVGDGFPRELATNRLTPIDGTASAEPCDSPNVATHNGKGPMVTQSLQGLLNFEVGGDGFALVTNAPYHWRGDKVTFLDFNEAFVNLQGAQDLVVDAPDLIQEGLTPAEMALYEEFINSIHYPPNPQQPRTRVYGGSFGTANVETDGSGALRGLKLYHIQTTPNLPGSGERSCVQCHALPEGSNNRVTFLIDPFGGDIDAGTLYPNELKLQPLESPALRGLLQKEGRLEFSSTITLGTLSRDVRRSGDLGFGAFGITGISRNDFLTRIVSGPTQFDLGEINEFVRQFDHGVAPIVGKTVTIIKGDVLDTGTGYTIADVEKQALVADMQSQTQIANCGLAVYAQLASGTLERGFWYRIDTGAASFQESVTGVTRSLSDLLDLLDLDDDVLIFTATPLGSDRRVASLSGVGDVLAAGAGPTGVFFEDTRPNSAYAVVVDHVSGPMTAHLPGNGLAQDEFRSLDAMVALQKSLPTLFPAPRHDVPRRLRLTGNDLFPGAEVRLWFDTPNGFKHVTMPVYPYLDGAEVLWTTAVELEPTILYVMLLRGFNDASMQALLRDPFGVTLTSTNPQYGLDARNAGNASWSPQLDQELQY